MEILNFTDANRKEILVQMINKVIDGKQLSNKESAHTLLFFLVRLGYKVTIIVSSSRYLLSV